MPFPSDRSPHPCLTSRPPALRPIRIWLPTPTAVSRAGSFPAYSPQATFTSATTRPAQGNPPVWYTRHPPSDSPFRLAVDPDGRVFSTWADRVSCWEPTRGRETVCGRFDKELQALCLDVELMKTKRKPALEPVEAEEGTPVLTEG